MADGEIENTIYSSLNTGSGTGAAVEVKFEKNPNQTQKYLEAEPKALGNIIDHVLGIEMLMYLTQFAISATLAGFCCKVIQCCTVRNSVPVIMLSAPQGPQ
ncbi:hypothetical protein C0J50_9407 [Silurus asotus]|uniref:Uncharacterized protein n=1 Tax=Silurus asotus TaxID=30991 RepID=A0AAD5FBK8_SILAS|nr:hypothetical protein C0J50_9407 [Silurus asotus]